MRNIESNANIFKFTLATLFVTGILTREIAAHLKERLDNIFILSKSANIFFFTDIYTLPLKQRFHNDYFTILIRSLNKRMLTLTKS